MNGQTDEQKSCVLQDFIPFGAAVVGSGEAGNL